MPEKATGDLISSLEIRTTKNRRVLANSDSPMTGVPEEGKVES